MDTPFFSVLVPVYNVEKYIDICVKSIVKQDFSDFELILLDDGSTDRSGFICDEWAEKDDRITVIHRENRGLFTTRLDEIQASKGQYLVFVDSDDFIEPGALSTINRLINTNECDVVVYKYNIVDENGKKIGESESVYENDSIFCETDRSTLLEASLKDNRLISIWSKCVKREILESKVESLREYRNINYGEDRVFTANIFVSLSKMIYCTETLYGYRCAGQGMTSTLKPDRIDGYLTVLDAYYQTLHMCWVSENKYLMKKFWERQYFLVVWLLVEHLRQGINNSDYTRIYYKAKNIIHHEGAIDSKKFRLQLLLLAPEFTPVTGKLIRKIRNNTLSRREKKSDNGEA